MADANDSSGSPSQNMIEVARQIGESLPDHEHAAFVVIAIDRRTGAVGWVSQVQVAHMVEALGNIVRSQVN